jgi:hypothetical protein
MPATNELLQEGRYRIGQRANGTGDVFEAYDTVRNTNVVVREIPVKLNKVTTVSQQESLKVAFANQAKALTEIDHDALLHVHDFFSEIDRQYLVMEAVDGTDLGELLAQSKKAFSVSQVTAWADQLLDALNYLHSRKPSIIHRNIKPQNLKLHSSGKIKLLGVGLETAAEPEMLGSHADTSGLRYSPLEQIWPGLDTASQKVITNSYDDRSERILKGPADARSDIYSLGATLYFLITGHEPVDPLERSIDILEGKLDPLREPIKVNSQIAPEVSDVLMKALEIKRENRYDSALIMRQVLQTAIERVAEREAEEVLEQKEAAEIIRVAAYSKTAPPAATQEVETDQAAQNELVEKQLREAEEERRLAEQRAAETERLLREKEEAEKAAAEAEALRREKEKAEKAAAEAEALRRETEEAERAAAEAEALRREKEEAEAAEVEAAAADIERPEQNVLEIPVAAEVMAYKHTDAVDEDELAAVLKELEEAEAESVGPQVEAVLVEEEIHEDDVQIIEAPIDMAPQPSALTGSHEEVDDDLFATPEKTEFSLPMPAIAGAIGLVLMIGVGGWFAMSGSSEPAKPAEAQAVPASQPVSADPVPADSTTSTQAPPETVSAAVETPTEDPAISAKAAATPTKAKKTDAPKPPPEKKKAVTVDDLINDN